MDIAVRLDRHAPRFVAAPAANVAVAALRGRPEALEWEGAMEWPLVGREGVVRRLTAILDRDVSAGLTLSGSEGVGKTRLAAELGRLIEARGRRVEWISASSSAAQIPFGAVAHLLALPQRTADLSLLMATLLAELGRHGRDGAPLLLIVDDSHHLDEQTAALIHQVATHRTASLLLTARSEEPAPAAISQLWKDRGAERFELGPLTREATRRLVEAVLEGPVDALTLTELWQRSGGNPLFLRELIVGGQESGALQREAGSWRATSAFAPSTRLAEMVRSRLASLGPGEKAIVDALAVAHRLEYAMVERIGGGPSVEHLEERHLLEIDQQSNRASVRLAHPIYGEVVAVDMPRSRARRIKRMLADLLQQVGARRPEDLLRLAIWRIDGGGTGDPEMLIAAARKALAAFDAVLAERLARAAMAEAGDSFDGLLVLGEALASQHRVGDADHVLRRAAERARHDDQLAAVALARANLLYFRAGRIEEAAAILIDALAVLSDENWRDEIESLLALFRAAAGELRAVAAAGRRLLERDRTEPRALVHTLVFSSIANVMLGRFSEAEEHARIGLESAGGAADEFPLSADMLRINNAMAHAYAGRLREALELAQAGHRGALDQRVPEVTAMWGMNLAECQLLAGQIEPALQTMLGALTLIRERDPFSVHGIDAAVAAICATWLGRDQLAQQLRQEIIDLNLARDVRSRIWLDRAGLWITWLEDGAETAAKVALEAAQRAVADTHLVWGAALYHDAARLGLAAPAAARLDALARRIEGRLVATMALYARALADADALAMERAASSFEKLGSWLFAAEAAAQAQRLYVLGGRVRLGRVAAARAALLASHCPGVRTPPLADIAPVPLTTRELEIARLAATGMSSRELSERLGISVRTVDNHLGTIYSKLGIAGRIELPSVLGPSFANSILAPAPPE